MPAIDKSYRDTKAVIDNHKLYKDPLSRSFAFEFELESGEGAISQTDASKLASIINAGFEKSSPQVSAKESYYGI